MDYFQNNTVHLHYTQQKHLKNTTIITFMRLGEQIKIVRIQKKMSQSDLAKAAEIHQKNISKYENEGVVPSAVILKKIADAMEVSADYLLGGEGNESIKDIALLKLFKEIDKMPEDAKTALMEVAGAYVRDFKAKQAYQA